MLSFPLILDHTLEVLRDFLPLTLVATLLFFVGTALGPSVMVFCNLYAPLAFVSLLLVRLEGTSSFVLAWFTSVLPSNSLFFCSKGYIQ